jgi:hypothetical protein
LQNQQALPQSYSEYKEKVMTSIIVMKSTEKVDSAAAVGAFGLNTMFSIRLSGEAIQHLARGAWEELRRQTRLTYFFDSDDYTMEN